VQQSIRLKMKTATFRSSRDVYLVALTGMTSNEIISDIQAVLDLAKM
jgi:hypothetical protein